MLIERFTVTPDTVVAGSEVTLTFELVVGPEGWPEGQWCELYFSRQKSWSPPIVPSKPSARFSRIINTVVDVLDPEFDPYCLICQAWYPSGAGSSARVGLRPADASLKPGTTVRVTYGYREHDLPPVICQYYVGDVTFGLREGFGINGRTRKLHTATVRVVPGPPRQVELQAPTVVQRGEAFPVRVAAFDKCRNLAGSPLKNSLELTGVPDAPIEVALADANSLRRDVRLDQEGVAHLALSSREGDSLETADASMPIFDLRHERTPAPWAFIDPLLRPAWEPPRKTSRSIDLAALTARSNPVKVVEDKPKYCVYWGDLHGHTDMSPCGATPIDACYSYARDEAALDIVAMTDHESAHDPALWEKTIAAAEAHRRPGEFVTLLGYEWTSKVYGHRNVYFPEASSPVLPEVHFKFAHWKMTPDELYQMLGDRECLIVPHHPLAVINWDFFDDRERLVEIYSGWGRSEYVGNTYWEHISFTGGGVQDALAKGHRYGFIAGSDDHAGGPGRCRSWPEGANQGMRSGLMAVLAETLTRESVYEALKSRRCYATTGERIYLDFRIDGALMGSETTAEGEVTIAAEVAGTDCLAKVEVLRDNQVIHERSDLDDTAAFELQDDPGPDGTRCYYLRVTQNDGNMAWSSPIWVDVT